MKKHTRKFFERWLRSNNLTVHDMINHYHLATGRNVSIDDMLNDTTATWTYYASIC